jgi:VanZ family protein
LPSRWPSCSAIWSLAVPAAIAVLFVANPAQPTMLREALLDAGHAPLFGVIALGLLRPCSRSRRAGFRRYALAWVGTLFLGAGTELAQLLCARDADVRDVARDVLGATAALLFASALRPATDGLIRWRWPRILAGLGLLGVAFSPVAMLGLAYAERDAAFPRICDFDGGWFRRFAGVIDARMTVVGRRWECGPKGGEHVVEITLLPSDYPGFWIREPVADWSAFRTLEFEVYSDLSTDQELVLRIDDAGHNGRYEDRFDRTIVIRPGCNPVVVPLADVRAAPRGRAMDMTQIRHVGLFAVRPSVPMTLYLTSFRLLRR